jgi:putative amide transporter protein
VEQLRFLTGVTNLVWPDLLNVGAILCMNGLGMLSLIEPRETAIMNIFTGMIAFLVCVHNAFWGGSDVQIQSCAYGLLFSFTYLWIAYNNLTKQDGRGLDWFSFFVAVTAAAKAQPSFLTYLCHSGRITFDGKTAN